MSIGFSIAIRAVPFFDLLDEEEESLVAQVIEAGGDQAETAAMDATRRRLAQGVDAFVRSLPTAVRGDVNASRMAAYALVGLVDERMLHHPAGGLERWRERLLEFELYGSALAGQEIVTQAQAASLGTMSPQADEVGGAALLAPLYLGIFRAGFEGSLRGSTSELSSLIASLEETVGTGRAVSAGLASAARPTRFGLATMPLVAIGLAVWLIGGFHVWLLLSREPLSQARRIADHVVAAMPVADDVQQPFERSAGPVQLTPLDDPEFDAPANQGQRPADNDHEGQYPAGTSR